MNKLTNQIIKDGIQIRTEAGNHYGNVGFSVQDGKYFLVVEDYCGTYGEEISEEFYLAAVKEFGNDQ